MNKDIISKIDGMIEDYTDSLISDTIRFVNIKSESGEPAPGAPFGEGPRKFLDAISEMAEKEGFYTTDYGVGFVSFAMEDKEPELGIWIHGDVVPAGDGWNYPPYDATLYKNCIIGRGATDNKGQLSAVFNLFKIFKRLGIKLKYNPGIYVGSNEESGMKDMKGIPGNPYAKGFMNVCKFPRLSLVPDSGFPVAYGARGLTAFKIKTTTPLHGFTFEAGQRATPGLASAVFDRLDLPDSLPLCQVKKDSKTVVTAYTDPVHSSVVSDDGNMITHLASALLECGAVDEKDRYILEFFRDISLDGAGKIFGLDIVPEFMKPTTVSSQSVDFDNGYCELTLKIRYPIDLTYEEIRDRITDVCKEKGFEVSSETGNLPYVNPKDTDAVKALNRVANEVIGVEKEPFICGSTYAHYIPNAYVYGMNGSNPPEDFPKGHGGAHGKDEAVSVDRLKRAMRIYARALLELDDIDW